jgi:hypothetical protein
MNVRRLASILVVSLALRADPATLQQSAGIIKQEFDRLPSSAVLDVNGGRVTKGEVLARLERARSGRLARKGSLDLRALNAALARKATLAVSADNAEVQAMKPQSTRIVRVPHSEDRGDFPRSARGARRGVLHQRLWLRKGRDSAA